MLSVDDKAPDFTLSNTKKDNVTLSDFSDQIVVLAFYPGAFTGVCDTEMCTLQDNLNSFNSLNAKVLGISVDSPFCNNAFSEKYKLEFNLLSDYNRKVTEDYDVLFNGLGGLEGYTCCNRAVYIIKDGVIKYAWKAEPNPGVEPNYSEIKNFIESL